MKAFALVLLSVLTVPGPWAAVSFGETGACCLLDGSCTEGTEEDCEAIGGVYQGDYTDCVSTGCPSVNITKVSVDRQGDPTYQRLDPITYTVEYTVVAATPGETYDVKAVVKPRFGKGCKKEPPKKGMKGKAVARDYDVEEGDQVLTIDYKPNNPEKHYVIPNCAKEDKYVTVKYILKLYNAGTTELLAEDRHVEADQIFVQPSGGGGGGGVHHSLPGYDCSDCHTAGSAVRDCRYCH